MRESKTLEYKENITNTFLKTVSAYANYGSGKIIFGVSDDGTVKGLKDPQQLCLDIENKINDSISPVPEYVLDLDAEKSIIILTVYEGKHKPYLYKAKAYRRNDSATIETGHMELTRLILKGQNLTYEELPAGNQNLSFEILKAKLIQALHLRTVDEDTLKTLELYSDERGFNIAAELLADQNTLYGIDMVRFGSTIDILSNRCMVKNMSVLRQYDLAVEMYRQCYQYEQINGSLRETIEIIPEKAFREAVVNALVHRTWDIKSHIHISMFDDRIEIISPGGLPEGVNADEYLRGGISILRNRILGSVFYRLHMIEQFGTGIIRIQDAYAKSLTKPRFEITENTIRITLPILKQEMHMSKDEERVYLAIKSGFSTSSTIAAQCDFGKTKTTALLKTLVNMGCVMQSGRGRGIHYSVE